LLGRLEAQVRGKLIPPPAHPAGPALLGWLALHPGEHPRGGLATLLWPEMSLSNARAQLRSAVWALRRALGPCEGEVLDEPTTIGLRCTTDLQAFDALLEAGDRAGALALRRGPLLDGLDEHPWVLSARAEHERRLARVEAP
jgi:DNA-binding SARP family transcriptional activator